MFEKRLVGLVEIADRLDWPSLPAGQWWSARPGRGEIVLSHLVYRSLSHHFVIYLGVNEKSMFV